MKYSSRRKFIRQLGGTAAFLSTTPLAGLAKGETRLLRANTKVSANDKIRIATIGMGIMGFGDTHTALKVPGVELVAVCDLYDGRLIRAKEVFGNGIFTTRYFHEVLDRKDIDAVIIATSDHWHDHISIAAMKKGKHVYCEKPMVHHIQEGQAVIDTQKQTQKVYQVGSQRVSSVVYAEARRLYEAGEIGQLNMVECSLDRHSALGAWQYSIPPDASLQTVDWKTFLGDAPPHAWDPLRFFRWRNYRDYGTGVAGDLYVHLISGLHFITGTLGPHRILAGGELSYWKDGRDVPDVMAAILEYPKTDRHPAFTMTIRVNFASGGNGEAMTTKLIGTDGELNVGNNQFLLRRNKLPKAPGYGGWDSFSTFPKAIQEEFVRQYEAKYPPETRRAEKQPDITYAVPASYDERYDHFVNFFEAIRVGKPVVEDAVFGLRAAGPALAANKSYFEKKIIHWDPVKIKLVNT